LIGFLLASLLAKSVTFPVAKALASAPEVETCLDDLHERGAWLVAQLDPRPEAAGERTRLFVDPHRVELAGDGVGRREGFGRGEFGLGAVLSRESTECGCAVREESMGLPGGLFARTCATGVMAGQVIVGTVDILSPPVTPGVG
jgi:hypothetical protein